MPYNDKSPEYNFYSPFWQKQREAVAGQEAILKAGEKYLPRLTDQSDAEYKAYKERGLYINAPGQTVSSLVGLVFRKSPVVDLPTNIAEWEDDITAAGIGVEAAARLSLTELLTTGIIGWLIDLPSTSTAGKTVAQVRADGYRPYVKFYPAESIINFKTDTIKGQKILTLLVLTEKYLDPIDEFDTKNYKTRYRIFTLDEGICKYRVYDGDGIITEDDFIKVNGSTIDYIPFVMVNSEGESNSFTTPPLNDLVNITLSHYKLYTDYRHGMHYTALPTPVIAGYDDDEGKKPLTIGPAKAIVSDNENLKAWYLEFTGQGLATSEVELKNLRDSQAIFGVRLLRESTKGVEAAETAQINRAGETSNVASWAGIVADTLTRVLEIMAEWSNVNGDILVELNKDYTPVAMSAQELTAFVNAWSVGAISLKDLFYNLVRGELISENRDFDEFETDINSGGIINVDQFK